MLLLLLRAKVCPKKSALRVGPVLFHSNLRIGASSSHFSPGFCLLLLLLRRISLLSHRAAAATAAAAAAADGATAAATAAAAAARAAAAAAAAAVTLFSVVFTCFFFSSQQYSYKTMVWVCLLVTTDYLMSMRQQQPMGILWAHRPVENNYYRPPSTKAHKLTTVASILLKELLTTAIDKLSYYNSRTKHDGTCFRLGREEGRSNTNS